MFLDRDFSTFVPNEEEEGVEGLDREPELDPEGPEWPEEDEDEESEERC